MNMKMKNQMLLLFAASFCLLGQPYGLRPMVDVGLIVDMGSREGKIIHSSISMAISDFYSLHRDRQNRIVLHTRDSKGDPLLALSAAFNLLENDKAGVILSSKTSILEAMFLADFGDQTKTPVISISAPIGSSPSLNNHPYFIQLSQHESAEEKAIVAFIEFHKWENVILIHEVGDDWSNFFEDTKIHISYKTAVAASSKHDQNQIIEQLQTLKAMKTSVFVVHVSHVLASRLFVHAKRLGMISEGYVWIVTSKTMNHLQNLTDSSIFESMQGVIGFRSYIRESKELRDFTSRMRQDIYDHKEINMVEMMNVGLWAYDVAWSIAKAANNITRIVNGTNIDNFINRRLTSSTFEIINVMDKGERRVGFWTSAGKITKKLHAPASHGRHLSSGSTIDDLETIIWPGGTSTVPKGRLLQMSSKILRIGVPISKGFAQLLKVEHDLQTNTTIVSGFCIDVFKVAMAGLKYQVQYEFVPFGDINQNIGETYNNLVYEVYLQNYDAVVGDITITANRSLYVDFTLPYTDMGVGMVTRLIPKSSRNLWIFLKPLTRGLWLTIIGVYVLTASVISLIERPAFVEQSPPPSNGVVGRMFGFSFSILVFAHWEKLSSNLSRSVVLLWVFVVFILSSNYTATMTSMMTVQHIEFNSQMSNIGSRIGPVTQELVSKLNFEISNSTSMWLTSPEEFENALSEGSEHGGISAIVDEMPYIKIFLEKYSRHYSMIGPIMPSTNGFGFAFPKGSSMAADVSREIVKLREDGRLQKLESAWFKNPITSFDSEDSPSRVNPLTVGDFRGLFLISGTFSALAFLLFFVSLIYKNLHIIKKWGQPEFVKQYFCMLIFKNRRDSNVIYPELDNL